MWSKWPQGDSGGLVDHGIPLVVSSSWSVPILSSPQGGMRKAPPCLVEASQAPRAPILTPGRAQIYLVLCGVEERTPDKARLCLVLAMWPETKASSCLGLFPGQSNEGPCGVICKGSEPQLSHVKSCSGLSRGRSPGAHGDHTPCRAGGWRRCGSSPS